MPRIVSVQVSRHRPSGMIAARAGPLRLPREGDEASRRSVTRFRVALVVVDHHKTVRQSRPIYTVVRPRAVRMAYTAGSHRMGALRHERMFAVGRTTSRERRGDRVALTRAGLRAVIAALSRTPVGMDDNLVTCSTAVPRRRVQT